MRDIFEGILNPTNIKVVGVGGGGCNAINRMITSGVKNVDFIAINTDAQALAMNLAPTKIQIGTKVTKGLGAGADPQVAEMAAREDKEVIYETLKGADMVFITAGMGGGTGTGAAPVVAEIAREIGVLTVAIVTKPFLIEGKKRMERAENGIKRLKQYVDTLVAIPNQNLFKVIDKKTPLDKAFAKADEILMQSIQGMSDIITVPGLINVDFADVRTVLKEGGEALMGIGFDKDPKEAALKAINNPLVDNVTFKGAKAVLVNITGGPDLSLEDTHIVMEPINESADKEANIIMGTVIDPEMDDNIRVVVIATGFNNTSTEATLSQGMDKSLETIEKSREKDVEKVKVLPGIGKIISREEFLSKARTIRRQDYYDVPVEDGNVSIPAILRKNKSFTYSYDDEDGENRGAVRK